MQKNDLNAVEITDSAKKDGNLLSEDKLSNRNLFMYAFGTLVAGSSAAAAAFIPLAYTMIPDGGAFLLALLMNVSFASSQLSPTHICTAIISDYFGVTFFATVKKLLPLFLLTVLIACSYYMLLTAVF